MEKTAMRDDFNAELKAEKMKPIMEVPPNEVGPNEVVTRIIAGETANEIDERMKPIEEEYRF